MRLLILLFLVAFALTAFSQTPIQKPQRVTIPGLHHPVLAIDYNSKTANEKIKRSKRLIITGAVFISVSAAMIASGVILTLKTGDITYSVLAAGTIYGPIPIGFTTLGVGIHMKRRWTKIQNNLQMQGGILSNGHVGLALNF